jgi:hypothetical protein
MKMAYHRGEKRLVSVVAVKRHGDSSDQADNLNDRNGTESRIKS